MQIVAPIPIKSHESQYFYFILLFCIGGSGGGSSSISYKKPSKNAGIGTNKVKIPKNPKKIEEKKVLSF